MAAARTENARLTATVASESAEAAVLKSELDTLRGVLAKLTQEKYVYMNFILKFLI